MKQSDRISRDHEECLARLPPEQRETVLDETTRLLKRLRLATTVRVSDVDIVERLRSAFNGSRKTDVDERKKG